MNVIWSPYYIGGKSNKIKRYIIRNKLSQSWSHLSGYPISVGYPYDFGLSVDEKIGQGELGTVYEARDEFGDAYALKVVWLTGDIKKDSKLLREVKILKQLNHKNIVSLFDYNVIYDKSDNTMGLYMSMQLFSGSLKDYISNGVDYMTAMMLFLDICNGVQYLHSRGLMHRDLKPSNILVDYYSATCSIGDFGLSTLHVDSNESFAHYYDNQCGTAIYAAPEQLNGTAYNQKVDIFSLGCILMELLARFSNEKELHRGLNAIRHTRQLPSMFDYDKYKAEGNLIFDMTEYHASKRPRIGVVLRRVEEFIEIEEEHCHYIGDHH